MIKRFGSLYAGHVDLGDMGQRATPANERRYSDAHLASVFAKTEALARCMEESGFDTLWLAEHHFQHEGYECLPNLPMLCVHLAHLTSKLRFGCGFNISPMWHPIRLAEDFAQADHLTNGRVIFGVGRGYHTREVETFGAPLLDSEANRELFEEQVEVMFKAFHQSAFSHHGKYYDLPPKVPYRGYELRDLTLVPRPARLPVECWQPIVSGSPRGLDFMVKHRMKGIVAGGGSTVAEGPIRAYQAAWERAGESRALGEGLLSGIVFHLADTQEKAIAEARPFYEENVKMFGPLGFLGPLSDEQLGAINRPDGGWDALGVPSLEQACEAGTWYCGPPAGFVEYLQELQERFPGLEDVNVQSSMGTPEAVMVEQLQWFAADVKSVFDQARTAA